MPHLSGLEIGSLLETCNLPESSLLVVDSILEEIFLEKKARKNSSEINWYDELIIITQTKKEAEESEILE